MIRCPLLRPVALVLASVIAFSGCHEWRREPIAAAPLNQRHLPSVRVQMVDGRRMTLLRPRVLGDSLVGYRDSVAPGPASSHPAIESVPVAMALTEVRSIETRHVKGWKTGEVAIAVAVVLGLVFVNSLGGYFGGH